MISYCGFLPNTCMLLPLIDREKPISRSSAPEFQPIALYLTDVQSTQIAANLFEYWGNSMAAYDNIIRLVQSTR